MLACGDEWKELQGLFRTHVAQAGTSPAIGSPRHQPASQPANNAASNMCPGKDKPDFLDVEDEVMWYEYQARLARKRNAARVSQISGAE
eukprot:10197833-Karenia_brevis.AAC.1